MNNSYEHKAKLIEMYSSFLKRLPNLESLAIYTMKISLQIRDSSLDRIDKENVVEELMEMTNKYLKEDSIRNIEKYNKIISKVLVNLVPICSN